MDTNSTPYAEHLRLHFESFSFSQCPYGQTESDAQHVGHEPIADFVRWLLTGFDRRHPTVLFAHFGGRFDNIMLFRQFFLNGICPQMIRRGNKLYEMKIAKGAQNPEIIIRDSWNLMPVALGSLPGAFGLNVRDKEFFPHLANVETNYGRVLPQIPPKSDYLYGGMIPDRQRRFDAWYAAHQHEEFDLCEQLAAYCTNDTRILIEALIAFRTEFLQVSDPLERHALNDDEEEEDDEENGAAFEVADGGIDITWEPMTIASASMKHFRLNHLKRDQLAIVPERGYDTANTQSLLALKFLNWYAAEHGVRIQTAHSPGGEKKIGPSYTVDGYIADTDTVIEVNGCHWHAHDHPRHRFLPQTVMANGKTAAKIREADARRLAFIRTQVREVLVFWECEIGDAKRQDEGMQQSFAAYRDRGPISLKDAYHGGRVGPQRLHYQVSSGWTMKYYDVRSLYPYTNAVTAYPTGHPVRVNVIDDADSVVDWSDPDDIPVRGILKVFVVPPLRIDVPVLPVKFDQRLLFPLCRLCAIRYPEGGVRADYRCPHTSDEERGWVSTVTSIELAEALRNGYRCTAYYRSIEWENVQWDARVFRGYVAEFMAMKTHASGFPDDVQTEGEQQQFVDECEEMFGIHIDPDKMEHNKAKRTIAKLCNNSLWGRFSLRNGLSKTVVTDSPAELRALLDNPAIEVSAIDQLNDECVLITYASVNEWVEEHGCSNIMLSLWTTSAARLHLLRLMQAVVRAPNAVLIYTDTDSVCFAYREADGCPLATGPHLGDLSDEWPEHELLEFVSGGCKQYALRMRHCQTGEEKTVLKVRGITLCADACRLLHFETFKRSVLRYATADDGDETTIIIIIIIIIVVILAIELTSGRGTVEDLTIVGGITVRRSRTHCLCRNPFPYRSEAPPPNLFNKEQRVQQQQQQQQPRF
uniref:DNA-directed DNA polymerase n=1 Tax=Globodera pallida TaxID=36090 RepID=A0A183C8L0_GLOPA